MSDTDNDLEHEWPKGHLRYAGFWIRLAAGIIDAIIELILFIVVGSVFLTVAVFIIEATSYSGQLSWPLIAVAVLAVVCISWLYEAWFLNSERMATPGKMICGIIVIDARGRRISFGRATIRYLFKGFIPGTIRFISNTLTCLAFLYSLADVIFLIASDNKQSIHDMAAKTYVVYKNSLQQPTDTGVAPDSGEMPPDASILKQDH